MATGIFHIPLSAFHAYGTGISQSAHNVANLLTPRFKAGQVNFSELPAHKGVSPVISPDSLIASARSSHINVPRKPLIQASNTDLVKEMTNLISYSRTYQANAKITNSTDAMLGMVIDMKV